MSVNFVPARTETKVIVVSAPVVEITLTEAQAKNLRAVLGSTTPGDTDGHRLGDLGLFGIYETLTAKFGMTGFVGGVK